MSENTRGHSA